MPPLPKYVIARESPGCTHTLPSPEASADSSALGVTLPRNMPEEAAGDGSVVLVTSENPTHSPSESDALVTLTRWLPAP